MTHNEFNNLMSSINALSPDQMRQLVRELQSKMAAPAPANAGESAYDLASRAGLIGCIKGEPRSPTDLATNPKHMQGFGRE